jgi:DeoR family suf operon transcriptional repressor
MGLQLPQLAAHKGLRADILHELKRAQPLAVRELADKLGVTVNAVRHHLKELETERLVAYGREQRGVGAPTFAYRLTAEGEALFPSRYRETLTEVLDHLTQTVGRESAVRAFETRYEDLTRRLQVELAGVPGERRLEAVARLMSEAGYMAEWSETDGVFRFAEHNCALRAVAEKYPEICAAEEKFLEAALGAVVARRTHIVSGCNACEYAVTFNAPQPQELA